MVYTYKCPVCGLEIEVNSNPDYLKYGHLRRVDYDIEGNDVKEQCPSITLNRVWKAPIDIQIKGVK